MADPQAILREYAQLNQRRKTVGVPPLEYLRWLDLRGQLEQLFPGRPAPGASGETRVVVEFDDARELAEAAMFNVKPVGLFLATPFVPEQGTRFCLIVRLLDSDEELAAGVEVVSHNVGPGFSTASLGMGVRFTPGGSELCRRLAELGPPT